MSVSSVLNDPGLFRTQVFVGGKWLSAADAATFPLRNPSTGEELALIPQLGQAETANAIHTAHRAFSAWKALPAKSRAQVLRRWFELITEHADDIARLIVLEEGTPFAEAQREVAYAASFVEWFAEEAKRVKGDVMMSPEAGSRLVVLKEPVGVCAAITPWNFPAAMITRKAAPALAAGCTMVVKPAEQTPLTGLALAELADRAGVPVGVLNIVTGKARVIGAELTGNPLVRKITFTGSTDVDRILIARRDETFGPLAPLIRFTDEADAIRMANDTEFGLAAYLFASGAERIWRISAALESGMVGINTGAISNEVAPFGGASSRAWVGRARSTASMNIWSSNTSPGKARAASFEGE